MDERYRTELKVAFCVTGLLTALVFGVGVALGWSNTTLGTATLGAICIAAILHHDVMAWLARSRR